MSAIDISIHPDELETWADVPDGCVGALDLLALTLADQSGWRISVEFRNGITLTASPASPASPATETNGARMNTPEDRQIRLEALRLAHLANASDSTKVRIDAAEANYRFLTAAMDQESNS